MRLIYSGETYSRGPKNGHIYDVEILQFEKQSDEYIQGYRYYVEYNVAFSVISVRCKYKSLCTLMGDWKGIEKESVFVGKLVRDKIPEIIISDGEYPITEIVEDDDRYSKELTNKLMEECLEFSKEGTIEELADIVEVIYNILSHRNISISEFESIRNAKKFKRGSFDKRIYLKYLTQSE